MWIEWKEGKEGKKGGRGEVYCEEGDNRKAKQRSATYHVDLIDVSIPQ